MTPVAYEPFFTASVAASAALIGLLFVSVSNLLIGRLDRTRKQKPAAKEPPSAS